MNYAQLLIPDFSLILLGYLLCRFTALNRTVWGPIEGLVYYFLFPVLLFHSIIKTPIELATASSLMLAGLALGVSAIVLAYSVAYLPFVNRYFTSSEHASSCQIAFRFNSFIGLAITDRLLGASGVQMMAVIIGVCVPLFNIAAVWPMARHSQKPIGAELIKNPLILATLCGLTANLLHIRLAVWLDPTFNRIGAASIALGLMAAGAGLQLKALHQAKVLGAILLSIKHFILPILALLIAQLFQLTPAQTITLLAFSALPTASSSYVLAAKMGYDASIVAGMVTLSTLLGMFSLSFALGFLMPA